jgi:hypothetical protein
VTSSSIKEFSNGANLSIDDTAITTTREASLGSNSTTAGVNLDGKLLSNTSQRTMGKIKGHRPGWPGVWYPLSQMGNHIDVVLDDRQTFADWHGFGYCTDARACLDHMVGRLNACRLDKH